MGNREQETKIIETALKGVWSRYEVCTEEEMNMSI